MYRTNEIKFKLNIYLIFSKIKNYDIELVVCCSRDWRFKGETVLQFKIVYVFLLCYYMYTEGL